MEYLTLHRFLATTSIQLQWYTKALSTWNLMIKDNYVKTWDPSISKHFSTWCSRARAQGTQENMTPLLVKFIIAWPTVPRSSGLPHIVHKNKSLIPLLKCHACADCRMSLPLVINALKNEHVLISKYCREAESRLEKKISVGFTALSMCWQKWKPWKKYFTILVSCHPTGNHEKVTIQYVLKANKYTVTSLNFMIHDTRSIFGFPLNLWTIHLSYAAIPLTINVKC